MKERDFNHQEKISDTELLRLSAEIVASYLGHNEVDPDQLGSVISQVFGALNNLSGSAAPVQEVLKPAVPIKKSVTRDYLICLEDGKRLKMLKRYLSSNFNLTPDQYRAKWGLPTSYPMVAPAYTQQRSEFAKRIGLGKINAASKKPGPGQPRRGRRPAVMRPVE